MTTCLSSKYSVLNSTVELPGESFASFHNLARLASGYFADASNTMSLAEPPVKLHVILFPFDVGKITCHITIMSDIAFFGSSKQDLLVP